MVINKTQGLKNKNIIITAGPTWVPVDSVRVISNISTGETGVLLAERLSRLKAKVTLLLGPATVRCLSKNIKIINFKFFEELKNKLYKELKSGKTDILIHCAAVSDYRPAHRIKGKLDSGRVYDLKLLPLPKIIRGVKPLAPKVKLVMFKLEPEITDNLLIERTRESMLDYQADLAVANRINPRYKAFILDKNKIRGRADSKPELVEKLVNALQDL